MIRINDKEYWLPPMSIYRQNYYFIRFGRYTTPIARECLPDLAEKHDVKDARCFSSMTQMIWTVGFAEKTTATASNSTASGTQWNMFCRRKMTSLFVFKLFYPLSYRPRKRSYKPTLSDKIMLELARHRSVTVRHQTARNSVNNILYMKLLMKILSPDCRR